jgi:hypothetical protein
MLKDLKAHSDSNTVVVEDFNSPLSQMDRPSKQKINKEILELNDTINQMDLTEHFIQRQHYKRSSQQPMELSPK